MLVQWQSDVGRLAEEGRCFFLGSLVGMLKNYTLAYGSMFSGPLQQRAVMYASALQRARLIGCVVLKDLLWPLLPWLVWPVATMYLRQGVFYGLFTMAMHTVLLTGVYAVLQMMNQIPVQLDLSHPVLRDQPLLLEVMMRAPPLVPWARVIQAFSSVGAAFSLWKVARCLLGSQPQEGLEVKADVALRRSEAAFKQQLFASAMSASESLFKGNPQGASTALLSGLVLVLESDPKDHETAGFADGRTRRRIADAVARAQMPQSRGSRAVRVCQACQEGRSSLSRVAASRQWGRVLMEMVALVERLGRADRHEMSRGGALQDSPVADLGPAFEEADGPVCSSDDDGSLDKDEVSDDGSIDFAKELGLPAPEEDARVGKGRSKCAALAAIVVCIAVLAVLAAGPPDKRPAPEIGASASPH